MNIEPLSLTDSSPPALFDPLLREIRAFSQHENKSLTDAWLRMKEMLRNCHGHNLSKGNIIKIFYHGLNETTQEVLNAAYGGSSNSDTDKIMARMDAMTMKMDAQYKEFQSHSKPNPDHNDDDDDIPISYDPPVNPNDQPNDFETPINFVSDDEDEEPIPQPKPKEPKPLKIYSSKLVNSPSLLILLFSNGNDSKSSPLSYKIFVFTLQKKPIQYPRKQKHSISGVGTERMIFNINSAMKHSYSNDDTCFSIDVIDKILEEDSDALLNEGSEILHSTKETILEEKLFAKLDEFMAMTADENSEFESDT
ncbi:reverse transcriptase domain-containing protein [Tanacetum coccineum]